MHADEVDVDAGLVRRLLGEQLPQWADLPIEPVRSAGTENAIFRLGDDMAARLPRHPGAAGDAAREHEWLPRIGPQLPLATPVPLAIGAPGHGYPWEWSVARWLPGEVATSDRVADPRQAAIDLARFVTALQRLDPAGAPPAGRGRPLARRDDPVREAIAALEGALDTGAVTEVWEEALEAPVWEGPPVWSHGDLYDGNLLAQDGRLIGVIDWAGAGVGDPACDLIVAWSLFAVDAREAFRAGVGVDEATWARGRGWALSVALIALPYYRDTNPVMVANSEHRISEILAEHRGSGCAASGEP
jgi:aminoglycoside phosphotransferase (APT) family kinase protein